MENNLRKSDENDAVLLSIIPKRAFRPLTIEELEIKIQMKALIRNYERIMRWKKTLKKLIKYDFDYNFKKSLRLMDADRQKISKEIINSKSLYAC
jgi:hypothetical protein